MPMLHERVPSELAQFYDSYYDSFAKLFASTEQRHEAAMALALGQDIEGEEHHSRKILLAQWGSSDETLRQQSFSLYYLGSLVMTHQCEPFAIVRQGSVADIFDEEPIEDEIVVDHGTLSDYGIEHGLWVPRKTRTPNGDPTELVFASQIYLSDSKRITLDVVGEPEVTVGKAEPSPHKVYLGKSPLTDLPTYSASAQVHEFEVLWGQNARDVVTRLYEKAEINAKADWDIS